MTQATDDDRVIVLRIPKDVAKVSVLFLRDSKTRGLSVMTRFDAPDQGLNVGDIEHVAGLAGRRLAFNKDSGTRKDDPWTPLHRLWKAVGLSATPDQEPVSAAEMMERWREGDTAHMLEQQRLYAELNPAERAFFDAMKAENPSTFLMARLEDAAKRRYPGFFLGGVGVYGLDLSDRDKELLERWREYELKLLSRPLGPIRESRNEEEDNAQVQRDRGDEQDLLLQDRSEEQEGGREEGEG